MERTRVSEESVPWLVGIRGRVRADVNGKPVGLVTVDDGTVTLTDGGGDAQAVLVCDSEEDAMAIMRGELNPVVAALQGRLTIEGDITLAIKTLSGIRGSSPLAAQQPQPEA
jgi:hypothetical protein